MGIYHQTIPAIGTANAIDQPQWAQSHVVDVAGITFSDASVQTKAWPGSIGSATQITYNNAGTMAGSARFTWTDSTTSVLGLGEAGDTSVNVTLPANTALNGISLNFTAGSVTAGSGNKNGGSINMTGGNSSGAGTGGGINLASGNAAVGSIGGGGAFFLTAGNAAGSGPAGAFSLTAGNADTTGIGGTFSITGGYGGSVSGAGGNVQITAGASLSAAAGGDVIIGGGFPSGGQAGNVYIQTSPGFVTSGMRVDGLTSAVVVDVLLQLPNYTVAGLPTTTVKGSVAYVTDALAPAWNATAVGGGAVGVIVHWNGTNWKVG